MPSENYRRPKLSRGHKCDSGFGHGYHSFLMPDSRNQDTCSARRNLYMTHVVLGLAPGYSTSGAVRGCLTWPVIFWGVRAWPIIWRHLYILMDDSKVSDGRWYLMSLEKSEAPRVTRLGLFGIGWRWDRTG